MPAKLGDLSGNGAQRGPAGSRLCGRLAFAQCLAPPLPRWALGGSARLVPCCARRLLAAAAAAAAGAGGPNSKHSRRCAAHAASGAARGAAGAASAACLCWIRELAARGGRHEHGAGGEWGGARQGQGGVWLDRHPGPAGATAAAAGAAAAGGGGGHAGAAGARRLGARFLHGHRAGLRQQSKRAVPPAQPPSRPPRRNRSQPLPPRWGCRRADMRSKGGRKGSEQPGSTSGPHPCLGAALLPLALQPARQLLPRLSQLRRCSP